MQTDQPNNIENFSQPSIDQVNEATGLSKPSPDNPPWNNWTALGTWVASVIFIAVFPLMILLPYLAQQKVNFSNQEAAAEFIKTDPTSILLQILSVFPAHICTLILAWVVVTNYKKYSFRETLGWEWNGFKIWHSIIIVIAFFLLGIALTSIFGEPKNDFQEMLKNFRIIVIPVAILATFTAPLVEEVIYRGILYSSLQRTVGIFGAVVLVTFLFGLVHVPQYSKNFVPDVPTVSLLFMLSLTLTLIRVYTKNLLPCIVLHTVFNGIQSILLIVQPYLNEHIKQIPEQAPSFFHLLK